MAEIKFTRKELYDLVWATPLMTLAKKYAISDNGLRKVCKRMNIPLPQMGYWQKKNQGWHIHKKKLPNKYSGQEEITLRIRGDNNGKEEKGLSEFKKLKSEIENDTSISLAVPRRLVIPDSLIISFKEYLNGDRLHTNNHDGLIYGSWGKLNIRVSQKNISRALRFMDTLIKVLRTRGHEVVIGGRKTYTIIEGERIEIYLREKYNVSDTKNGWRSKEYTPNGRFAFYFGDIYKKEIKDGKVAIENQLAKIVAKLELEGHRELERRLKIEAYWKAQREKEQIEISKKKRVEKEFNDFMKLLYEANQWDQSRKLRNYIKMVEKSIEGIVSDEKEAWLNWANQKADWFDPLLQKEDTYLTGLDKKRISRSLIMRDNSGEDKGK